jgi:predicted enzyme related to lactoylglutathione lyase
MVNEFTIHSKNKTKVTMSTPKKMTAPSVVWFEIPADDLNRAQTFYKKLFGWKISPFRGMTDFLHVDTGGPDASPDGGMMTRKHPGQGITNYVNVPSVTRYLAKIEKLGGKICLPKTAVREMGYFAVCQDTEKNTFGIWELNPKAK